MRRGINNPGWILAASVSRPCQIRVVLITSVSRPCRIRVAFALSVSNPCQNLTIFVSDPWAWLFVRPRSTFVIITSVWHPRCPCRVRVTSLSSPHANLHRDVPRTWYEYDKDSTDTTRTRHGGDTDLIRTFVRVNYFDCLKIIDTDKFGPGDRGGHDTDVIRTWTGRQEHDTDTCPYHVRVSIRVCVNVPEGRGGEDAHFKITIELHLASIL